MRYARVTAAALYKARFGPYLALTLAGRRVISLQIERRYYPGANMKRISLVLLVCSAAVKTLPAQSAAQMEFFEKKIRPVFAEKCAGCHNASNLTAGLDLSTTEGIRKAVEYGGEAGVIVSKTNPDQSLLLQAVS